MGGSESITTHMQATAALLTRTSTAYKSFYDTYHASLISAGNFIAKTTSEVNAIKTNYDGKYVKHGNKIYKLNIRAATASELASWKYTQQLTFSNSSQLANVANYFHSVSRDLAVSSDQSSVQGIVGIEPSYGNGLYIEAILEDSPAVIEYTFNVAGSGSRNELLDAQYDIITFPYNPKETLQFYNSEGTLVELSNEASLAMANELMRVLVTTDSGYAIDLQLLPYCPIEFPITNGKMDLRELEAGIMYDEICAQVTNAVKTFAVYPLKANFSKYITLSSQMKTLDSNNILNKKLNNECCFSRLTSPNFNGTYEFKKAKLSNGISYFNLDCTYKPFAPYIKLNTNIDGLYGSD